MLFIKTIAAAQITELTLNELAQVLTNSTISGSLAQGNQHNIHLRNRQAFGYTAKLTTSGAVLLTDCQLRHLHVSYQPNLDLSLNILEGGRVLFHLLIYLCSFTAY